MFSIRAILLLSLFASSALASPIDHLSHLRAARDEAILYPRQDQSTLSQPITFQTVTTSQSDEGTITTTCTVTLSPVTAADGSTQVLEEKQCKIDLAASGESSSASSSNGGGDNTSTTSSSATAVPPISEIGVNTIPASATGTVSPPSLSSLSSSSSSSASASSTASGSAPQVVSVIGPGQIPASATGTVSPPSLSSLSSSSSSSASASATASGSTPPPVSVIGPGQIPASDTGTVEPTSTSGNDTASVTTPVTSVTTLGNGQVSTSIITPSAAAAQEASATTPGQKLEVLPIGLGVFAGVSVIALIVVGLVTYERTKYRKAFRQRKLAEAGANMGYGGMAERT